MSELPRVEWIRTGIPAIDLVIGAGIPRGRLVEVIGEYATAKSAFGYIAIAAFQRAGGQCLFLDSEAKTDRAFAEKMGVDFSKVGYSPGRTIKEVVQIIGRVAQQADPKIPTLIVWDSIAATPGVEELEDHIDPNKEFTGEKAARARYLSAALRAVMNELSSKNVTLIGVNQLRTNFNFMGRAFAESSGGKAVKYHAGVRLKMRQSGKIKHRDTDVVTGVQIEVEAVKNACAPPFRKASLRFKFDTGFDPYSGLDELLLRHGRLEQKGGWLTFKDKSFHAGDIERIVSEVPDLLLPLSGVLDNAAAAPSESSGVTEAGSKVEEPQEAEAD